MTGSYEDNVDVGISYIEKDSEELNGMKIIHEIELLGFSFMPESIRRKNMTEEAKKAEEEFMKTRPSAKTELLGTTEAGECKNCNRKQGQYFGGSKKVHPDEKDLIKHLYHLRRTDKDGNITDDGLYCKQCGEGRFGIEL